MFNSLPFFRIPFKKSILLWWTNFARSYPLSHSLIFISNFLPYKIVWQRLYLAGYPVMMLETQYRMHRVSLFVCPSICLYVCLFVCVCLCVCLGVSFWVSVCVCVCLCAYLSVCLSVCLSACVSASVSVSVCVCLCVCLCDCVFVCLRVCLCGCLPVCFSVNWMRTEWSNLLQFRNIYATSYSDT